MPRSKSILITGGASGIGLAITTHFASLTTTNSTHITVLDINPSIGSQALTSVRTTYPTASLSFETCDTSSWESQAAVFEKVYHERGRVDVVFANAGITESEAFIKNAVKGGDEDGKPVKPDSKTAEVNFWGVVYSVQLAIHYMAKNAPAGEAQSKGSIICTSSNAGLYAFPIAPIYAATKHAVVGFVRALARGLEKEKIQINALAPAVIETNIAPDAALFRSMVVTPMTTAIQAVTKFVDDASLSGKVAELHGDNVTFAEPPPYVDEDTRTNIEMFWKLGYA